MSAGIFLVCAAVLQSAVTLRQGAVTLWQGAVTGEPQNRAATFGAVPAAEVAAPAPAEPLATREDLLPQDGLLDPGIRKMVEAALADGDDPAAVKVLALARKLAPEALAELDGYDQVRMTRLAEAATRGEADRIHELTTRPVWKGWRGEGELGASKSTGTVSTVGIVAGLALERPGHNWSNAVSARFEVQSTDGVSNFERITASWQPKLRLGDRAYTFALASYEHDLQAGYDHRYTLGAGLGYKALVGKKIQLELEGGPTYRRVEAPAGLDQQLVGRGSLNLRWTVSPSLALTHTAAVYVDGGEGNATAQTALDTRLIGALKARFSYNLQYEGRAALPNELATQTRATLIYAF